MSVFREIEMHYEGKDYTLTPSNRLLRRIEAGLAPSSLTGVMTRVASANPPVSEIAYIVTEFLGAAGASDIDEDEVYGDMMADLADGGAGVRSMCEVILQAITPSVDVAKKSSGSAGKANQGPETQ